MRAGCCFRRWRSGDKRGCSKQGPKVLWGLSIEDSCCGRDQSAHFEMQARLSVHKERGLVSGSVVQKTLLFLVRDAR